MFLVCVFPTLIRPTLCTSGMRSQAISFTKSRLGLLPQSHKQGTRPSERKEGHLPPPYQAGLCVLSLFLEGCKTSARNASKYYCDTFINKRKLTPTAHRRRLETSLPKAKTGKDGRQNLSGCTAHQDFLSAQRDSGPSREMLPLSVCTPPLGQPCTGSEGLHHVHRHPGLPRVPRARALHPGSEGSWVRPRQQVPVLGLQMIMSCESWGQAWTLARAMEASTTAIHLLLRDQNCQTICVH